MSSDEVRDVVATAGELDWVVVLLREFLHRSGALRAVALLEADADGQARLVDCAQLEPTEVVQGGRSVWLAHAAELDPDRPVDVPVVRQLPPFEVDPDAGTIGSPMGGMEHYGRAVRSLAEVLAAPSVALVTFRTDRPDVPLSISARAGDPLVVALGEDEHEMDAGWPPAG